MTSKESASSNTAPAYRSLREVGQTMWGVHHWLAKTPLNWGKSADQRRRRSEDEVAVRDVMSRYVFFYDGRDVDGLLTTFHEDCVLVNRAGTWVGKEAIRSYYESVMSRFRANFHSTANVMVRFADDEAGSAWLACYFQALNLSSDGQLTAAFGTYADRLVKAQGEWKYIERRITGNLRYQLTQLQFGSTQSASGPQPTNRESADEWMRDT